jgi:hypothetical protein
VTTDTRAVQSELGHIIRDVVRMVNENSGQTNVRLRYCDDCDEISFVANSARLDGSNFEFVAGFETYCGSVQDLADLSATVIDRQ